MRIYIFVFLFLLMMFFSDKIEKTVQFSVRCDIFKILLKLTSIIEKTMKNFFLHLVVTEKYSKTHKKRGEGM